MICGGWASLCTGTDQNCHKLCARYHAAPWMTAKRSIAKVSCFIAAFSLVVNFGGANIGHAPIPGWAAPFPSGHDSSNGKVFLLSSESEEGRMGWLLCLDENSGGGWLYAPPFFARIRSDASGADGELHLRTGVLPDGNYYSLDIRTWAHSAEGRLSRHLAGPASQTQRYLVKGFEIEVPATSNQDVLGRYSNVRYVAASGDRVGVELLLFHAGRNICALAIFYEGYWGEPVLVPLVSSPSYTRRIGKSVVEFNLRVGSQTATYRATQRGGAVVLCRINVPVGQEAEQPRLLKQDHFLPSSP